LVGFLEEEREEWQNKALGTEGRYKVKKKCMLLKMA